MVKSITTSNKFKNKFKFNTGELYMVNSAILVYYKSLDIDTHVFFLTRSELFKRDRNRLHTKLLIDKELNQYIYVTSDIIVLSDDEIYSIIHLPTNERLSKDILDLLYFSNS